MQICGVLIPQLRTGFRQMVGGLVTEVFLEAHVFSKFIYLIIKFLFFSIFKTIGMKMKNFWMMN